MEHRIKQLITVLRNVDIPFTLIYSNMEQAIFELHHNDKDSLRVTVYDDGAYTVNCECADGSFMALPYTNTIDNMLIHLGMAMQFSNQRN